MEGIEKPNTVTCRRCGAPIFWIKTAKNNKNVPMDEQSIDLNEANLTDILGDLLGNFCRVENIQDRDCDWYRSHFSTCTGGEG